MQRRTSGERIAQIPGLNCFSRAHERLATKLDVVSPPCVGKNALDIHVVPPKKHVGYQQLVFVLEVVFRSETRLVARILPVADSCRSDGDQRGIVSVGLLWFHRTPGGRIERTIRLNTPRKVVPSVLLLNAEIQVSHGRGVGGSWVNTHKWKDGGMIVLKPIFEFPLAKGHQARPFRWKAGCCLVGLAGVPRGAQGGMICARIVWGYDVLLPGALFVQQGSSGISHVGLLAIAAVDVLYEYLCLGLSVSLVHGKRH